MITPRKSATFERDLKQVLTRQDVQAILLILVTAAGAALRLFRLGQWSFWYDEMFTVLRAQVVFSTPSWQPLNEYLIGAALRLWGTSEWSARFFPAIIGVMTIPIVFWLVRKLFNGPAGLIAATILAFTPWHIFWSQNSRFYATLLLFYTLALVLFYLGLEKDRRGFIVWSMVFLTLAIQERLLAFFLYPILIGYIVLILLLKWERPRGLTWKNLSFLLLPLVVYGLKEAALLAFGQEVVAGETFTTQPHSNIQAFFVLFLGNALPNPLWVMYSVLENIGMFLVGLGLVGGGWLFSRRDRRGLFLLLGAVLPLVMLFMLSFLAYVQDRYIFVSLTSWIILAAVAIQELITRLPGRHKLLAAGVLAGLLLILFSGIVQYFKYDNGNRDDWRGALGVVEQGWQEGDRLVAAFSELSQYYLGREAIVLADFSEETLLESEERVWIIDNGWLSPELQALVRREAQLLDVRDVPLREGTLRMRVFLYDPANR